MTSHEEVARDLAELAEPSVLIARLHGVLPADVLEEVASMQLDSADTLGMLWAALLENGDSPEAVLRQKGIIE